MRTKILLLFFAFSFLFKTDHSFDQDLGRHLRLGEIIWQTKSIPKTNLFSYTNPDFPFINTHWLFEVMAYLTGQTIGLHSLLFIKLIMFLISVYLILKIIPKDHKTLLLPIGFIFFHVLRERTELRPEIFSFFFTATTYYILKQFIVRAPQSGTNSARTFLNAVYLLPLIQLIWVNTHIYFFVGIVLQAIFLIHLGGVKLKILAVIFVFSILASLINPNGLAGLLYPLNVTKNYGYTIVENQTMFLLESINFHDPNFLFVKLSLGIILLSILVVILNTFASLSVNSVKNLKVKSRDPSLITQDDKMIKNILLTGFGAVLALMNVRSFPYLVFISLPAVLENLGTIKSTFWIRILILITIPLLLYESSLYLNGDYYKYTATDARPGLEFKESGKNALGFIITHNLPGPIYNNFDIGSYIIYRGYPAYKVFVDGRPEGYPKEFFQDIYMPTQSDLQKFKELDQKIQFKTIIFSHTDQTPWGKTFLTSIVKDSAWKTVYVDDFIIILASQGVSFKDTPLDLKKLNPSSYSFDSYLSYLKLSLFLVQTGNLESSRKFAERGLSLFPKSPLGNALFGINVQNHFFW